MLTTLLLAAFASVTSEPRKPGVASPLPEIEGPGIVSTPASEVRATISPDGQWIVWGSTDRPGSAGGWDLWRARKVAGRWAAPEPLALNTPAKEFDPAISADGQWLYFFSDRPGGAGGDDLYRAPLAADGTVGTAVSLGNAVNTAGNEWAPWPSSDGQRLLFASDGHGGAGRHDLFVAQWDPDLGSFSDAVAVPGVNTEADEFDAVWLDDGGELLFARSDNADSAPINLWLASCDPEGGYAKAARWAHPLNRADGYTLGPVVSGQSLLLSAQSTPGAKLDIIRVGLPVVDGEAGCGGVRAGGQPQSAGAISANTRCGMGAGSMSSIRCQYAHDRPSMIPGGARRNASRNASSSR